MNRPYRAVKYGTQASDSSARRWARGDWIDLAVDRLKWFGPSELTLDRLCAAANRTRGSFYHHFASVDELIAELADRWRDTETEAIAQRTLNEADALAGLALMAKLTDAIDHRLERGVRVLAMSNERLRDLVEVVDVRRESVMQELLMRGYALEADAAASGARLFHALHQTAVMRSPEDIRGYTRPTIRKLVSWLQLSSKPASAAG